MSKTLKEVLAWREKEVARFLALTEGMSREEVAHIAISWLGTKQAKVMNDFLEKPMPR